MIRGDIISGTSTSSTTSAGWIVTLAVLNSQQLLAATYCL